VNHPPKGTPLGYGRVADGLGGSTLHPWRGKRVKVTLTVAQWEAVASALGCALTAGNEWSDGDHLRGEELKEHTRDVERAEEAHREINQAIEASK